MLTNAVIVYGKYSYRLQNLFDCKQNHITYSPFCFMIVVSRFWKIQGDDNQYAAKYGLTCAMWRDNNCVT